MPQFINMKVHKIIIGLLSLFVASTLYLGHAKDSFVQLSATTNSVEGYYARASQSSSLSGNILFDLVENDIPVSESGFKIESADSLTLLKENGSTVYLPSNYIDTVDVFYKQSETQYLIPKTIFDEVGGIATGDTLVLNGNFVRDDYSLHIKESKLYVYTRDAIVTVPHQINNISQYLVDAKASKDVYKDHNWNFLIWANELPFEEVPITVDDGYYPTSIHCVCVNGQPHANCLYDGVRRRTEETELLVCGQAQVGSFNPVVGTVVVLDGVFNYKNYKAGQYSQNPILDLEPGESFGIQIDLLAMLKVGSGVDDYQMIDLRSYLMDQFDLLYDSDLYEPDYYEYISDIRNQLNEGIYNSNTAKEIYSFYNYAVSLMDSLEISPDKFEEFKTKYIKEISNYVDVLDYMDSEANTIEGAISTCIAKIGSATKTKEIVDAVNAAKSDIDVVDTRLAIMERAILNGEEGYINYLCSYDSVTLNDLSLGEEQVFHGKRSERSSDINTNVQNKNQFNVFSTGPDNPNGNVEFNFTYKSNATPKYGANVFFLLRGVKYNGYKFGFGTDSGGFFFQCTSNNEDVKDTFMGDGGKISFALNTLYRIRISAIDLIEGNRTWIRVVINGFEYISAIVDSLPECINPRVAITYNGDERSDVPGTAVIGNYYPSSIKSTVTPIYCGRFAYESSSSDSKKVMQLSLEENELKYSDSGVGSYALKEDNIKFIRNGIEQKLANTNAAFISKNAPTSYQLSLTKLFNSNEPDIQDGDTIVISGRFGYFDEDSKLKTTFEVGASKFVYSSLTNSWGIVEELSDIKEDALRKLDYFVSQSYLSKYDEEEQQAIINIVNSAKQSVNSAATSEAVIEVLNDASSSINEIFTSFEKYQNAALLTLSSYKENEYSQYREEELQDIMTIKESFAMNISHASTIEEVSSLLNQALEKIDAVLTDEQMKEIELNDAKHQGQQAIKDRYAALVNDSMSEEELAKLNNETLAAIEAVKAATSVDAVNSVVDSFLNSHPLPSQNTSSGCGGNIVTSSITLTSLAVLLLTLIIIKKWKYSSIGGTNHE